MEEPMLEVGSAPGSAGSVVDALQVQVLHAYAALMQLRISWAGHLMLLPCAGELETALSYAGVVAGALVLAIDSDADRQRHALRNGACNFVVNTPDEALRVLKNEARRGAPLSVGFKADAAVELPRLVARGLLPSLIVCAGLARIDGVQAGSDPIARAIACFARMGCTVWLRNPEDLATVMFRPELSLHHFTLPHPGARQRFDEAALSLMPPEDAFRRRWLEAAARILPRTRFVSRSLYLLPQEAAQLHDAAAKLS